MTEYTIKITGIRTANVGELSDAVKQINFDIVGTRDGEQYSISDQISLADPDPATFVPYSSLTENQVIEWVEQDVEKLTPLKTYIDFQLDRQIAAKTLVEKAPPWINTPQ